MIKLKHLSKYFELVSDFFFEKPGTLTYKIVKKRPYPKNTPIAVVLHEYASFPADRVKSFPGVSYSCGRRNVVAALDNIDNAYKILTVAIEADKNKLCEDYKDFDMVIETNNYGQDFGGYFSAISELKQDGCEWVILSNSSQFLEPSQLRSFILAKQDSKDLLGIGCAMGPNFYLIRKFHLQSYLLRLHLSEAKAIFDRIGAKVTSYKGKYRIISHGEIAFSRESRVRGLRPVIFSNKGLFPISKAFQEKVLIFRKFDSRLQTNQWCDFKVLKSSEETL